MILKLKQCVCVVISFMVTTGILVIDVDNESLVFLFQTDFGQFRTVNVISQEEFQSIIPFVSTPNQQVPPPPPVTLQSSKFLSLQVLLPIK